MVTFRIGASLQAGHQYKIAFTFTSILNDYLQGFYRSSYVENGVTKYPMLFHTIIITILLRFRPKLLQIFGYYTI